MPESSWSERDWQQKANHSREAGQDQQMFGGMGK
jgi:hypothetical protein